MTSEGKPRRLRSYISQLSKEKRATRLTVRLTFLEKEQFARAAKREGLDLSSFIRRLLSLRNGSRPRIAKALGEDAAPPSSKRTP